MLAWAATTDAVGVPSPEEDPEDRLAAAERLATFEGDLVIELLPHRWKETFGSGFTVERIVAPGGAT